MLVHRYWPMLAILVGVGPALTAPAGSIKQAKPFAGKTLIWGADCDGGIPYVIKDPTGKSKEDEPDGPVTGFEADIRDALEIELGCRIIFKQLKFENLYLDVDRGNCDLAMNGLEITPENQARVLFSKPYYLYQQQFVTRVDETEFSSLEQCRDMGFTVGTLTGCAAVKVLKDRGFDSENIKQYDDQDGPYKDLSLNRSIRAVLLDLPAALYYVAPDPHLRFGQPIKGLRFAGQPFAPGLYGIAVKKDNTMLAAQLDVAIDRLRERGELKRILSKWEVWNPDQYDLFLEKPPAHGEVAESWTFDRYFPVLLQGAYWTVYITVFSFALAMAIGLVLSLMRLYGPPLVNLVAVGYIESFRGIPVLLLLYFLYYGLGHFGEVWHVDALKLEPLTAAILGFGLNYAAYEAEIYRAGIGSIPIGQWEAAASLGMSSPLAFRRIVLPQAVKVILPPMTNDFVALFKDTSVVSIIAVNELSKEYQILTKTGGYVEIGLCTAALYLIMSVPLGYLSRYLEKRWTVK